MRFILFDRVTTAIPGTEAAGIKNVSAQEEFLIDHYPRRPVMPAPLIVESLAQLGGWAITTATQYAALALMVMVKQIEVTGSAVPGDRIDLKVTIQTINDYGAQVTGAAYVAGTPILTVGTITYVLYSVPPEEREAVKQRYQYYTR
ncbi:MAG: hypothetical protein N3B18_03465 [Desulfobacterota bacterium]|nr:hypothetical protein [Thermodesulfobacteriota bacterium]